MTNPAIYRTDAPMLQFLLPDNLFLPARGILYSKPWYVHFKLWYVHFKAWYVHFKLWYIHTKAWNIKYVGELRKNLREEAK